MVLIDEPPAGDMDAWFASLLHQEPTNLPVSAAELVAEARSETE